MGEKLKERWANHIKLRKFPEPKIVSTKKQSEDSGKKYQRGSKPLPFSQCFLCICLQLLEKMGEEKPQEVTVLWQAPEPAGRRVGSPGWRSSRSRHRAVLCHTVPCHSVPCCAMSCTVLTGACCCAGLGDEGVGASIARGVRRAGKIIYLDGEIYSRWHCVL